MIIKILSLGKFKVNQKFKSIFEYYQKRIKFKTVLIELKTYENNKKKELEKLEILKFLKNQDHKNVFVLDKSGENFSSLEFADLLNNKINSGCKKLNFIIGSDQGLDSFFKDSFLTISFGNQTWPHLLIRVMLIEQIYRGLEIIKNSRYHK
jgi:23S rRNA (pseudouridine1915-N3)-methyltransferase